MLDYKDFGKVFDIPNFPAGTSVEQPSFNYETEKLQDFLFFYMSSNMPADNVDIEIKLINGEGTETAWKMFIVLPGTNGQIDSNIVNDFVGFGFKLKATNNSGNLITNFKTWLQGKTI